MFEPDAALTPVTPAPAADPKVRAAASEHVVLVDSDDRPVGTAPKLVAHLAPGRLHRAFSVFVVDETGRMLLQRRASSKYHFGGLWTNACCSHQRPDEPSIDAGRRRLAEELGIDATPAPVGRFTYRAEDRSSGLVEHEVDHVMLARWSGDPSPNPSEADDWRWVTALELAAELRRDRAGFTPWFPLALDVLERTGHADRPMPPPAR